MRPLARTVAYLLVAGLCCATHPSAVADLLIDDFSMPGTPVALVMPSQDGETALVETADADILGGERDVLFDIIGTPTRLIGFSAEFNNNLLYYDGHSPGATAILQYDGLDADLTAPPELVLSEGLGGVDLTDGGSLFQFSIYFASVDHAMDIEIEVHSATGVATYMGTTSARPSTPTALHAPFRLFTGDDVFTEATSIEFRFNPTGVENIDFQLNAIAITAPEPSTIAIWGLGLTGVFGCAWRRRRR